MVNVKLRTIKTEENRTPIVSVPTLEEIIEQFDTSIPFITEEGRNKLAERVGEIIREGNSIFPSGKFSRAFTPKKVKILISEWDNEYIMTIRMTYPGDYSSLIMPPPIKVDDIEFHPVFVINTQELYLHFVR